MDSMVKAMWAGLAVVIVLDISAGVLCATAGLRDLWLLQGACALTGGWALIGAAIGFARPRRFIGAQ